MLEIIHRIPTNEHLRPHTKNILSVMFRFLEVDVCSFKRVISQILYWILLLFVIVLSFDNFFFLCLTDRK